MTTTLSLPPLTDTQRRIIWGIENGETVYDLEEHLGIHHDTVREHERKLKRRLGCDTRGELPFAARATYGTLYDQPATA
jgi:DNA-binding CsgD family transcriptional regulator